jgi:hypothetical protein
MSQSTRKYHRLELQYPGLGPANLVRRALSVLSFPSQLSPSEVQYHFEVCQFCVDLTQTNVTTFGDLIEKKLVHYFRKFKWGVKWYGVLLCDLPDGHEWLLTIETITKYI